VVKGKAPVDPECSAAESVHVFVEGSDIYDVMLNQVRLLPYLTGSLANFWNFYVIHYNVMC